MTEAKYCGWCWNDQLIIDGRCTRCGHNPAIKDVGCDCPKCVASEQAHAEFVARQKEAKKWKRRPGRTSRKYPTGKAKKNQQKDYPS